MANGIAVVTVSGFGKSSSLGASQELGIKGLNPKETVIINVKGKPLPFRGWAKMYVPPISSGGNYYAGTDYVAIANILDHINVERHDIKNVVIDDFQYLLAEQFMQDALKTGYEKFSKLAKNAYDILSRGLNMRHDINFIILTHAEEVKHGLTETYKMKTIGKLLDEKVTLEGLFTILLYGKQDFNSTSKQVSKQFVTNYDGQYPAKSPIGMFKELYIPNDLGYVVDSINAYYNGEDAPTPVIENTSINSENT